MFVHTGANLPADPEYPVNLKELGYEVNGERQIVSIGDGNHFIFFNTSNERANEKRKEAMHESVRRIVADELMELGVDEVYLNGNDGTSIAAMHREGKPHGKSISILASKAYELVSKGDVVVVIGDPGEDAAIWAWRHLLRDGGIVGGSAVGLVKKLIPLDLDSRDRETQKKDTNVTIIDPRERGYGLGAWNPRTPGLIILNPGALYWSNADEKTMTWTSWMARPREHALGEDYAINDTHNFVEGHHNAREHIDSCLDEVLPTLLSSRTAQLYVVAMSNSAEYFIDWYNKRYSADPNSGIHKQVAAMAFMQPTHDPTKVTCLFAEQTLNVYGQQWVTSSEPLAILLNHPNVLVESNVAEAAEVGEEALAGDEISKEKVNCATYSGATDIEEMIWPNAMDKVLAFFKSQADKTADGA